MKQAIFAGKSCVKQISQKFEVSHGLAARPGGVRFPLAAALKPHLIRPSEGQGIDETDVENIKDRST